MAGKIKENRKVVIGTISGGLCIVWIFSLITGFNLFTWIRNVITVGNTSTLTSAVAKNAESIVKNAEKIGGNLESTKLLGERLDDEFEAIGKKLDASITIMFLISSKLDIQIPPNIKRDLLSSSNPNNHFIKKVLVEAKHKSGKGR